MIRRHIICPAALGAVWAVAVAALFTGGCSCDRTSDVPNGGASATSSVDATGSANATGTGSSGPATVTAEQREALSAIDRELSAIEDGLEALSMPSDEDFRAAEDALF